MPPPRVSTLVNYVGLAEAIFTIRPADRVRKLGRTPSEFFIAGRVAFVTGASKGISRVVAEGLAAEGCHLHLSSRSEAGLKSVDDTVWRQAWEL